MAVLTVYTFPNPILKQTAQPVEVFDEKLEQLATNMLETMYDSNGIGLAANQVGVLKRIVVVDIFSGDENPDNRDPHVFVNPKIVEKTGEVVSEEGCLSVVEFTAKIQRFEQIVLEFQDIKGQKQHLKTDGLEAICLQHELDHLNGILFIDHLPLLKQKMIKRKLIKLAEKSA